MTNITNLNFGHLETPFNKEDSLTANYASRSWAELTREITISTYIINPISGLPIDSPSLTLQLGKKESGTFLFEKALDETITRFRISLEELSDL
jgi:hypothetical protein